MATNLIGDLLGEILGDVVGDRLLPSRSGIGEFTNVDKFLLAATAIASYVIARIVFTALGLPAVPGVSALLLQSGVIYGILCAGVVFLLLTALARPIVGRIRPDAPVFCAAIGLLALPTHGGDLRNALLDAGGPGVYVSMAVEIVLLAVIIALAYGVSFFRATAVTPLLQPDATELENPQSPELDEYIDTPADRAMAVGVQFILTLALLLLLGQSPMKGQALISVAFAGGLASWINFKARNVRGSVWYVAGTLLAGFIAYAWTRTQPDGFPIGDTRGYLAGAARSLPLHYATAGVAGTIYGNWSARAGAQDEG